MGQSAACRTMLVAVLLCCFGVTTCQSSAATPAYHAAAWGADSSNQLGAVPCCQDRKTPAAVATVPAVVDVSAGSAHGLALDATGTVWEWGSCCGEFHSFPGCGHTCPAVKVTGLPPIAQIAAGVGTDYALDRSGKVWAWGLRATFTSSVGYNSSATPVQLPGVSNVARIVTDDDEFDHSTFAIGRDGSLWAWSTYQGRNAPGPIAGISGVVDVAGAFDYHLGVKRDGTVWDITPTIKSQGKKPATQIKGIGNVASLVIGTEGVVPDVGVLALTRAGTVWAWGLNEKGQLGIPSLKPCNLCSYKIPRQIPGLAHITEIAAGHGPRMAVRSDGTLFAWGDPSTFPMNVTARHNAACKCVTTPSAVSGVSGVGRVTIGNTFAVVAERALPPDGTLPKASCPLPAAASPTGAFPRTVSVGYAPESLVAGTTPARAFSVAAGPTDNSYAFPCSGTAAVIDPRTGALLHAIRLDTGPKPVAVSDRLNRLLIGNAGDQEKTQTRSQGSVTIINTNTGKQVATTKLGTIPYDIWLDDVTGLAVVDVVSAPDGGLSGTVILDARTGKLLRTMTDHVFYAWVDPASGNIATTDKSGVKVLDGHTGAVLRSFSAGEGCNGEPLFYDQPTKRLLIVGGDICVIDAAQGKVLRTAPTPCAGGFYPQAADRHLFFDKFGDKYEGGEFCLMNLDTFKADYREGINGVDVEAILPQEHEMLDGESDCFNCDGHNWIRSTATGKAIRRAPIDYNQVLVDAPSNRVYLIAGHSLRAYGAKTWKLLFTASTKASLNGPAQLFHGAHRLVVAGGQNPKGGVVTTFCTDSPCK